MHPPQPPAGRIAALILAAGASTRFGRPKQLARIGGLTMLEAVIQVAHDAALDPILAVVPPGIAVPPDVVPVPNPDPAAGLSRSLQLGVAAVPEDADAAVILLGDQPTLDASVIRSLLDARQPTRHFTAARSGDLLAPPIVLDRASFGLVAALSGDVGLRDWLREHGDEVTAVDVDAHAPDVDTQDDLHELAGR